MVIQFATVVNRFLIFNHEVGKNNSVMLTIAKHELNNRAVFLFLNNGKEILYRKKMYDILQRKEKGSSIEFTCLEDKNELKLLHNLSCFIKSMFDNKSGNFAKGKLLKFQFSVFISKSFSRLNFFFDSTKLSCYLFPVFSSFVTQLFSPPPEV